MADRQVGGFQKISTQVLNPDYDLLLYQRDTDKELRTIAINNALASAGQSFAHEDQFFDWKFLDPVIQLNRENESTEGEFALFDLKIADVGDKKSGHHSKYIPSSARWVLIVMDQVNLGYGTGNQEFEFLAVGQKNVILENIQFPLNKFISVPEGYSWDAAIDYIPEGEDSSNMAAKNTVRFVCYASQLNQQNFWAYAWSFP